METYVTNAICMLEQLKRQQELINQLLFEHSAFIDGVNAIVDPDDSDNVWFYYDDEDNFVESLNDEVTVVMSACALKKILKGWRDDKTKDS